MAAEFVPLADLLRAPAGAAVSPCLAGEPEPDDAALDPALVPPHDAPPEVHAAVRAARLFRARLADALDAASARLVRELASDVLARELRLAPCDLDALVRQTLERAPVIRVRVAAADVARVHGVACVADPTLAPGDALVELHGGLLDARFGVRLATVLDGFA